MAHASLLRVAPRYRQRLVLLRTGVVYRGPRRRARVLLDVNVNKKQLVQIVVSGVSGKRQLHTARVSLSMASPVQALGLSVSMDRIATHRASHSWNCEAVFRQCLVSTLQTTVAGPM